MRTRSLILGAIVMVVATAISIFALRALTPTNDVIDGVALATVVVSTRDIQANRHMTPLIDRGVFMEIEVPGLRPRGRGGHRCDSDGERHHDR